MKNSEIITIFKYQLHEFDGFTSFIVNTVHTKKSHFWKKDTFGTPKTKTNITLKRVQLKYI